MMAHTVHAHQFSFGDRRHCFDIYVPPHEHGHSLRIVMDPQAQVGTLTILRYDPNSSTSNPDTSRSRRVETLAEHMQNFQPFRPASRPDPSSPSSAPVYQSSHNTFIRDVPPLANSADHTSGQDANDSDEEYNVMAPPSTPIPATPQRSRGITVYPPGSARVQFAAPPSSQATGVPSSAQRGQTPNTPQGNQSSDYIPFHRRSPQCHVDGDDNPDIFSVPQNFRNIYPPTTKVGEFRTWWSVISGYEIGVFCDNWLTSRLSTHPSFGLPNAAKCTWRSCIDLKDEAPRLAATTMRKGNTGVSTVSILISTVLAVSFRGMLKILYIVLRSGQMNALIELPYAHLALSYNLGTLTTKSAGFPRTFARISRLLTRRVSTSSLFASVAVALLEKISNSSVIAGILLHPLSLEPPSLSTFLTPSI
ncbi:hypothetical protein EYR40_004556 [Pleurotus pulmonarius]|nr:hypothetical protein EYR40_004556 [Pleurotus pulmonarius]